MKKFKPMLLVMIAAFLMFATSVSASSYVTTTKWKNETYVQSDSIHTNGGKVRLRGGYTGPGKATIMFMYSVDGTSRYGPIGTYSFDTFMSGRTFTDYVDVPSGGYFYVVITGDETAEANGRIDYKK
ncbi:hypothetical protein [Paenibacillus polymyxa]|uniref:hypothetical protein n=1 Tax=Paenibacillus polymyxa TaxID=1406 RepID=UPI00296F1DBC|nr:hypothetical protein [Paenibacillus polymyxa]WOZ36397.1 hypothetical protein RQP19_13465 [Paenibacillus polymyxa]